MSFDPAIYDYVYPEMTRVKVYVTSDKTLRGMLNAFVRTAGLDGITIRDTVPEILEHNWDGCKLYSDDRETVYHCSILGTSENRPDYWVFDYLVRRKDYKFDVLSDDHWVLKKLNRK
jgi:hypothetical protein